MRAADASVARPRRANNCCGERHFGASYGAVELVMSRGENERKRLSLALELHLEAIDKARRKTYPARGGSPLPDKLPHHLDGLWKCGLRRKKTMLGRWQHLMPFFFWLLFGLLIWL